MLARRADGGSVETVDISDNFGVFLVGEHVFVYYGSMSTAAPATAELRASVLSLVAALDPAVLSGESAALVVRDLAVIEKAAATGRMFAALRVAQSDAWRGQGHASAADWLAAQCGITVREAASQLGTAKKAEDLPKTKAAMRKGDLSPDQAEAVTGAAAADPGVEDSLLDSARNDTTSQLRDKAAKAKAAATDSATRERRIRAARSSSKPCCDPSRNRPSAPGAATASATPSRTAPTTRSSPCSRTSRVAAPSPPP